MLNQIILMGRLTADPELRQTAGGINVTSFSLAVERSRKNKDSGDRETDFIRCTAWRGTAEFVCRYFGKGKLCAVSGRLQIASYTDKDGIRRLSPEVLVQDVFFCDSGAKTGLECNPTYPDGKTAHTAFRDVTDMEPVEEDDGELPF